MTRWFKFIILLSVVCSAASAFDLPPMIDGNATEGFPLVENGQAATIYVDANDSPTVRKVAALFADDVKRVSGIRPQIVNDLTMLSGNVVLIGSLPGSAAVKQLVAAGKTDCAAIADQRETFQIQTIDQPMKGVSRALLIAGSDRRGAAYGALELSEQIGVSPWYFWADVPPKHSQRLLIKPGTYRSHPPTVRYRGIFINDEDWGLNQWASKTFDPQLGNIGPKTYDKVFELLLRLKANYCWPAMHKCSTEFGSIEKNIELADEWGIVMGASHCEPMNRNNIWWDADKQGEWRFNTNRDAMIQYWREWAQRRGKYEAVWTVGMRGIHDSALKYPPDLPGQVKSIGEAIQAQRQLLGQFVNSDVKSVPQVFMPYKEALTQYRAGLDVPDDVTIMWCDDNFGYVRQLSSDAERKRSGGSGVYYHLSYLGRPKPYLWINTTPPALIWEEMRKALDYGADRIWVLNVGDIKPGEIGMEFFLRMAYDASRYGPDAQPVFLRDFAARQFGQERADDIAAVMNTYYRLGAQRKPELMDTQVFGPLGESAARVGEAQQMLQHTTTVESSLPSEARDAFFELVKYPVLIAAKVAEVFDAADQNQLAVRQSRPAAAKLNADRMAAALDSINSETNYFNDTLAGGKWKQIIMVRGNDRGRGLDWPKPTTLPASTQPTWCLLLPHQADPLGAAASAAAIDIDLTAAKPPTPWQVSTTQPAVVVPGAISRADKPDSSKVIECIFTVARTQSLNLFVLSDSPSDRQNSFFYRIDHSPWKTWEDSHGRFGFNWSDAITRVELAEGSHTLSIAPRDTGCSIAKFRLVDSVSAQALAEQFADRQIGSIRFSDLSDRPQELIVYRTDGQPVSVKSVSTAAWLKAEPSEGTEEEQHVLLSVDWSQVPAHAEASIAVQVDDETRSVSVTANHSERGKAAPGEFIESDGCVSIDANQMTHVKPSNGVSWIAVAGLGRTGNAISALPSGGASRNSLDEVTRDPVVAEYAFNISESGQAKVDVYCLPTHRTCDGHSVRYAVSVDDAQPTIVNYSEEGGAAGEMSPRWANNVSRNIVVTSTPIQLAAAGHHVLKLWMVDPGVVVDKLVVRRNAGPASELGPPASQRGK